MKKIFMLFLLILLIFSVGCEAIQAIEADITATEAINLDSQTEILDKSNNNDTDSQSEDLYSVADAADEPEFAPLEPDDSSINIENVEDVEEFTDIPQIISVEDLTDTANFSKHALVHIFYGQINSKGKATGYHSESIPNEHGTVIEGSETAPNQHGTYEAKVKVDGVNKSGNNGKSTFFPKDWDAQTVVNAINEAYESRQFVKGSDNTYRGMANEDYVIEMYLDNNNRIISAFPIY